MDAVVLGDYNKGVLNSDSISHIIQMAGEAGKPIYVDPKKANFNMYKNVRFFKPNLIEFKNAYAVNESLEVAGFKLKNELNADILMITRSADGVSLFNGSDYHHIPTKARQVHDVSGAGDTVIASLVLAKCGDCCLEEASRFASLCASYVCSQLGAVPVDFERILELNEENFC